ncbi:MAG: methylated-DNA--[protein]-cysteine S-methyltransferase [Pseudomonadota bacterium]
MNRAPISLTSGPRVTSAPPPLDYYDAILAGPVPGVKIALREENGALCDVNFIDDGAPDQAPRTALGRRAAAQLRAYFADPRRPLDLPLALTGTPFQKRVWAALCAIPAGETRRYGELAELLGSGPRAVGGACRANPIPLFVPCHRVVAAGGAGGFMGRVEGPALALKHWLLQHERAMP